MGSNLFVSEIFNTKIVSAKETVGIKAREGVILILMDLETGHQENPDTIISIFLNTTACTYFQFPKREY